jgi:spore germination protein KA
MYRRPKRRLFRKMLQEIERLKMEFAQEISTGSGFSKSLQDNLQSIQNELHSSADLVIRRFTLGLKKNHQAAVVFIDGLVDKKQIEWSILQPLMTQPEVVASLSAEDLLPQIMAKLITVGEAKPQDDLSQIIESVLAGNTALLVDGIASAVIISTPGWEKRGISEPEAEVNIRGPKEGFIETLRSNTAMLRRKIGHPDLTMVQMTIGQRSKTDVCIAYLKGVAPDPLITEIRRRLQRIKTDIIVGSGGIEEFIADHPLSLFSTIGHTERPEVVAAKLAEGRAAILIDGTPFALTMPFLFVENFQYPDDYNFHFIFATLIRWIRYTAFFISFLFPAAYVALTSFHQELLPTPLLITMAAATEGSPFPRVVEVIGMGLVFEIIREGGVRLPRPIGQAISIVGALVIGQAAVQAGLVAAPTVIVIASTAVTTFLFPSLVDETTSLRILLVIITGFLGAFGLITSLLVILTHLAAIRSFGVPYLAPLSPVDLRELTQDVLIRAPWWMMWKRPRMLAAADAKERQQFRLMPNPPKKGKDKAPK